MHQLATPVCVGSRDRASARGHVISVPLGDRRGAAALVGDWSALRRRTRRTESALRLTPLSPPARSHTHTHTHTHTFNGPLSRTTRVSRYQKGKTNLDFTEARDGGWQWHQLDHMQVCTSLQTDNHTSTPPLSFYRPDALPATQPTASKHCLLLQ